MTTARTALLLLASLALTACYPARPPKGDSGGSPSDTDGTPHYNGAHEDGWNHGLAAKHQELACTDCHGADLTGGSSGPTCDGCHPADWRTDCTFCHGGDQDGSGAPPEDMDDASTGISFPEHGAHIDGDTHRSSDCEQCHLVPTGIFSTGHLFVGDTTPAVAEVSMADGLSRQGSYTSGSCTNAYCHGNGIGQTVTARTGDTYDCGDCHGDSRSARQLSGRHNDHMGEGLTCGDCHSSTVSGNDHIVGPTRHVNGTVDVAITELTYSGGSCSGSCHGEHHSNEHWTGGDDD